MTTTICVGFIIKYCFVCHGLRDEFVHPTIMKNNMRFRVIYSHSTYYL